MVDKKDKDKQQEERTSAYDEEVFKSSWGGGDLNHSREIGKNLTPQDIKNEAIRHHKATHENPDNIIGTRDVTHH
jgi:hypothetical protein